MADTKTSTWAGSGAHKPVVRVKNRCANGWRCTVCGAVETRPK